MAYPGLVVFDLDFTLWDCGGLWIDCTSHPFTKAHDGGVSDSAGRRFRLYDEVEEVIRELEASHIPLALASRTERPDWALELLDLWGLNEHFQFQEIYPDSKVSHFETLHRESGVPFDEMIFFDDEERNIVEVSGLGVLCHHVKGGVNLDILADVLERFSEKA